MSYFIFSKYWIKYIYEWFKEYFRELVFRIEPVAVFDWTLYRVSQIIMRISWIKYFTQKQYLRGGE